MPPKHKKKLIPDKQAASDSSTLPSPVQTTTNYREIHQNEVEALQSIYGDDYEPVENRRSAWQVRSPCLAVVGMTDVDTLIAIL